MRGIGASGQKTQPPDKFFFNLVLDHSLSRNLGRDRWLIDVSDGRFTAPRIGFSTAGACDSDQRFVGPVIAIARQAASR